MTGMSLCISVFAAELSGSLGPGLSLAPAYSGSSHAYFKPVLRGDITLRSEDHGALGLTTDGLFWRLFPSTPFGVTLLAEWEQGRKEVIHYPFSGRRFRYLEGMDDMPSTLLAGVEFSDEIGSVSSSLKIVYATKKRDDGEVSLGRTLVVTLGTEKHLALTEQVVRTVGADITGWNQGLLQGYYGVSPRQASRTAFSEYHPDAGFQQTGIYSEINYHITQRTALGLSQRTNYLLPEAGRSPLVKQRLNHLVSTSIEYHF